MSKKLSVIGDRNQQMENKKIKTFEELKCWQACRDLRLFIAREVIPKLPSEEKYRLGDQLTRAVRSTTANITEGYGRFHYKDNAKFCSNSRGSCWEVMDHLITAHDEKLITSQLFARGKELVNTSLKLINGYMTYLQRAGKQTSDDPSSPITDNG
jgi:four helix bundle protein